MSADLVLALITFGVGVLLGFVPIFVFRLVARQATGPLANPTQAFENTAAARRLALQPGARAATFRILDDDHPLAAPGMRARGFRVLGEGEVEIAPDAPCWIRGTPIRDHDHTSCN
jgi:hypothetical protein